ncbi:4'-phosphopantetheinyl transferase family protein, partial [Streptomyces sp. PAL114]|uniref:4'-phosphopantetheinyl transferase family protein n=1 Tax=Streptomyces sp. PAL114 TaxID=2970893 RepID=UPI0028FD3A9B
RGRDMSGVEASGAPLHVPGPEGPWEEVCDRFESAGRAVVHTTWGEWLTAALLDPELRGLLGRDRPRCRHNPAAAGRLAFAVSRVVMKHTAAAVLHTAPAALDIAYLPGGQPTLRGFGGELWLSLAHTEELIVVAVSRSGPVGVDTESVTRRVSFEALHGQVCTPQEAALLAALPDDRRAARFLRLWTLKEAYTKALGQGMRRGFGTVGFRWDGDGRAVLADDSPAARAWTFTTCLVRDRYLVSEAGQDTGRDTGRDSGRDTGRVPGLDAGRVPDRDAGRDAGRVEDRLRGDPGPLARTGLPPAQTVRSWGLGTPVGDERGR